MRFWRLGVNGWFCILWENWDVFGVLNSVFEVKSWLYGFIIDKFFRLDLSGFIGDFILYEELLLFFFFFMMFFRFCVNLFSLRRDNMRLDDEINLLICVFIVLCLFLFYWLFVWFSIFWFSVFVWSCFCSFFWSLSSFFCCFRISFSWYMMLLFFLVLFWFLRFWVCWYRVCMCKLDLEMFLLSLVMFCFFLFFCIRFIKFFIEFRVCSFSFLAFWFLVEFVGFWLFFFWFFFVNIVMVRFFWSVVYNEINISLFDGIYIYWLSNDLIIGNN